jgi:hypothetical protein
MMGKAVDRFARLKDLAIPIVSKGCRLEAHHDVCAERVAADVLADHAHPPVLDRQLVATAGPALMIGRQKDDAVLHEPPASAWHRHGPGVIMLCRRRILRGHACRECGERTGDNCCAP